MPVGSQRQAWEVMLLQHGCFGVGGWGVAGVGWRGWEGWGKVYPTQVGMTVGSQGQDLEVKSLYAWGGVGGP